MWYADAMATLDQRVRHEILRIPTADGGLDLVDLVLERVTSLDAIEARAFAAAAGTDPEEGALALRLGEVDLLEGPESEALRQSAWAGRKVRRPRPIEGLPVPVPGDWELARALPDFFSEPWRDPETWRRLAEQHAGGQRYLNMAGLVRREVALQILAEVKTLAMSRLETEVVRADRHLLGAADVPTWLDLLMGETFRALVGAVLGRAMPPGLVVNAWRLGRGDYMGVHPDSRMYFGTVSLGLCEGWSACDGGAIAFGMPRPTGMEVRQRWYPHLGDVGLFAPEGDTWHAVEAVRTRKTRLSLTGWWVDPEQGLTRGRS